MIKIHDTNNNFLKTINFYKDARIEKELNITDTLEFYIPKEYRDLIQTEGYVKTKEGNFVIKEKNLKGNEYQVIGKYDVEELLAWVESKSYVTMSINEMFEDLLDGTGWTYEVNSTDTKKRTVTGTELTTLELIYKMMDTFNYEVIFDNLTKTIYVGSQLGANKGVYFHDELNLTELETSSDTHDFATRLIPVGFDGMGIESINDGKNYVENHEYSNKIVTVLWEDGRYTDIESLKADAERKLEGLAKELRSFKANVVDLSRLDEYKFLSYDLGDTVTLIERESKFKEKQRIVKKVIYLNELEKDEIILENKPRALGEEQSKIIDNLRTEFNITKASLELFEDSIVATVTEIQGTVVDLNEDIEGLEENLQGQITDNTGEISVQANQIAGKVSQTEYDENYNLINENFSEVEIEMDNIRAGIQVGGGNNLIKNSVGYGDLNYWNVINDDDYTLGNSTWILKGASKYGFIFSNFEIEQDLKLEPNKEYTISGKLQKNTPAGKINISLNDNQGLVHEVINLTTETYEGQFSLEFNSGENAELILNIKGLDLSTAEPSQLTDLFLVQGKNNEVWSQANGEVYTLNVKVDGEGIRVYGVEGKGHTIMSPEEFAGYYNNEQVFTVNRDITEVMGLLVKKQGLFIPPVKMAQNGNVSLDIVWTGGI